MNIMEDIETEYKIIYEKEEGKKLEEFFVTLDQAKQRADELNSEPLIVAPYIYEIRKKLLKVYEPKPAMEMIAPEKSLLEEKAMDLNESYKENIRKVVGDYIYDNMNFIERIIKEGLNKYIKESVDKSLNI